MGLFKTIDGLLAGAVYLAWAICLVGIVGSVVLFFVNLSMGFASAITCVAALLLFVGGTLLLLPKKLQKGKLGGNKRLVIGAVAVILAAIIMAIVFFVNGGLPTLNLLFA